MNHTNSNNSNAERTLKSLSKYVEYIHRKGFDSRLFYFNRSRLFLSCTSESISSQKRSKKTLLLFLLVSFIRLLKGLLSFTNERSVMIVDTRETHGKIWKKEGYVTDNTILTYLFDHLDWQKIGLIDRFNIPFDGNPFQSNWRSFTKNTFSRPRIYEEVILFRYLISHPFSWRNVKRRVIDNFNTLRNHFFDNEEFELINSTFLTYQNSTSFFAWKEEAYTWYFKSSKIKKVMIMDEYSPNQRSILNAFSRLNIETIALQHGGMHSLHPGYVYNAEDKNLNIFPNQFLTWGSKFSHFLKFHGWEISLSEVGHLRTDIIYLMNQSDKSKIKKIMFASQPHKDENYTERVAKLVFTAFANLEEEVVTFVRPHPLERDVEKYEKWANWVGYSNIKIETDGDLYASLANTDILITAFSTVGQEAVYFKIPLITVDYLGRDIASYLKEGVALNAPNSDELTSILNKKLANPDIDHGHYQQFIEKYAHRIDGKVHDRILKVLLSE